MAKKTILVTGAAGFIGFHTSLALAKRGDLVLGIDDFNNYYDVKLKRDRGKELEKHGVSICEVSLNDQRLFSVIEGFAPSHLLHLAAQAGVRHSLDYPELYIDSNIRGFLSILEVVRAHPHIKLVYASSSSVYGRNNQLPYSTKDLTDEQASLYGVTKKTNELMASTYHHLYGIHATGLRYFTVYGPWGRPDMAYYSFTRKLFEGSIIQLFNEGKSSRDFTYIDDIVQGNLAALDRCSGLNLYNLGQHQPDLIETLVSILEEKTGQKAQLERLPLLKGDMKATFADIENSKHELGWEPKVSLEKGLSLFVDWFKSYFDIECSHS